METRTPRFNEAIEKYFAECPTGPQTCPETGEQFELEPRVLSAYRELATPPSRRSWWAQLRRMRAELAGSDFFPRVIEDGRTVITAFDPDSPVKLLPSKDWYDARLHDGLLAYGRPIDPSRSFFEQWSVFTKTVPRPALIQDPKSEKAEWTNYCVETRNSYFGYIEWRNEDTLYCDYGEWDKHSCDITGCDRAEWSYGCVRCDDISQCFFCLRCNAGVDLMFCRSCVNCQSCFGCSNLQNKKYCFLNEQLTEAEYKQRLAQIDLSDHRVLNEWHQKIQETIWETTPYKALVTKNTENCIGDDLQSCRDSIGIICYENDRSYFGFGAFETKDCCVIAPSSKTERCVYSQQLEKGFENKMCSSCFECMTIEYSESLLNCQYCFGCIGLQNKKYCIFNVQYSEEEYWRLVDQIKTTMLALGEYGEFFPYESSLVAFNASNAEFFFPTSEADARKMGARWFDFLAYQATQPENAALMELPAKLSDFTDAMLNNVFRCEQSGRLYRIVKPELEWHRKFNLALPRLHPSVRRKARYADIYPIKLRETTCKNCQAVTNTRVPERLDRLIYCQTCHEALMINT